MFTVLQFGGHKSEDSSLLFSGGSRDPLSIFLQPTATTSLSPQPSLSKPVELTCIFLMKDPQALGLLPLPCLKNSFEKTVQNKIGLCAVTCFRRLVVGEKLLCCYLANTPSYNPGCKCCKCCQIFSNLISLCNFHFPLSVTRQFQLEGIEVQETLMVRRTLFYLPQMEYEVLYIILVNVTGPHLHLSWWHRKHMSRQLMEGTQFVFLRQ